MTLEPRQPFRYRLAVSLALGACGALQGCGSNGDAGTVAVMEAGADQDHAALDAAGGGADVAPSDASSLHPDGSLPDGSSGMTDAGEDDDADALPRCAYPDGAAFGQCAPGLICLRNGSSCDPPAPPGCGEELCVDCSNPPARFASDCAQGCVPPCGNSEVCVGTQNFESYPGDAGIADCPSGTEIFGPYCESPPVFGCAPAPNLDACGGSLECTCAASLCTGKEMCGSSSVRQVDCYGMP
jgi:hypothetical protein